MCKNPGIMCHWVAGYPDKRGFLQVVSLLDDCPRTEWIEIQLPFSDPMADGSVIMAANHETLGTGFSLSDAFSLLNELNGRLRARLAVMTYANIPLAMGIWKFMKRLKRCGVKGLIVPDLPFDTPEGAELIASSRHCGVSWIPVLSPGMNEDRLEAILRLGAGMVYLTSKLGVTGSASVSGPSPFDMISRIRKQTALPVALGFGIQSVQAVNRLTGVADIAVIGTHLLRLYTRDGYVGVRGFMKDLS